MKRILFAGMLLAATSSWAHLPAGVTFPAVQFPDDKIPTIDGNLVEWDIIPQGYWLTHEQLTETVIGVGTAWDATDMAVRVIVGWNPTTNRVYAMEDRFDNVILVRSHWEPMEFVLDADHSGGMFGVFPDVTDQEQKDRVHGAQAQDYGWNQGGTGTGLTAWHKAQWHTQPPFGQFVSTQTAPEGGEGFFRSEYMVTPWNDLDWNGPETSTIQQLTENAIIGFHFTIIDDDDVEAAGYEGYWTLSGATDSYFQGDLLSDFLLAPIDSDIPWGSQQTAVAQTSWGRIKSTFHE